MIRFRFAALVVTLGFLALVTLSVVQAAGLGAGQSPAAALPSFTDVTGPAGVAAVLTSWGASWGDPDGDGFPDLLTFSHERLPEFYHNNGNGTFVDIVASTPLSDSLDRHSAAWGDYDNDGDQDLVIAVGAQAGGGDHPGELYRNDAGVLVSVTVEAGVADGLARGRAVSWADYDRDGDLDYFAANHLRDGVPSRLWRNNGDGTFTDAAAAAGVADVMSLNLGVFVDYDRDGWSDIFVEGIGLLLLYHNNADGTFTNVAVAAGFAGEASDVFAWGDYDGDGDADLFLGDAGNAVADRVEWQDTVLLFAGDVLRQDDGIDFEVAGEELRIELELRGPDDCTTLACIHIGELGISPTRNPFTVGPEAYGTPVYTPAVSSGYYIWRDVGTDLWHIRLSHPSLFRYGGIVQASSPYTSVTPVGLEPPPPLGGTQLWRNEGDGTFTEVAAAAGVDVPGNFRSANWVDVDNDGWLDLFAVDKGNVGTGNLPDRLFRNNGDGTFQDVAPLVGVTGTSEGGGNVSAWADLDGNGFLDLFTQNGGFGGIWPFEEGPNQLFRNEGNGNHWLELDLVGTVSNRSGLGAVVRLTSGGRTQVVAAGDGRGAYDQNGNPLHFGLGASTMVETIVISWPSGIEQTLADMPADQVLTIVEAEPAQRYGLFLPLVQS
jgi:hypothetical protein